MTGNTKGEVVLLLCAAYLVGGLAGAWLGLAAATVTGMAVSEPPRFPGEDAVDAAYLNLLLYAYLLMLQIPARRARQIRVRNLI